MLGDNDPMNNKQETALLREIGRLYNDCPERVSTYTRWKWMAVGIGLLLCLLAGLLSGGKNPNAEHGVWVGLLAGVAFGSAIWFRSAAKQLPLLIRYTTLNEEAFEQRLEELKE